ncbi:MAG: GNAT family N-acetyltransferase [Terracidiphilus sp.]|jgi:ribosomal protein S18 acetylase RimI-like enzyme
MPITDLTSPAPASFAPDSFKEVSGVSLLDNPILNSLRTGHSSLAVTQGVARRFPAEIGPLSGVPDQSEESYADLRELAGPQSVVALFLDEPPAPPPGWTLLRGGLLDQMVCDEPRRRQPHLLPLEAEMRPLTAEDAHAMVVLATLTEPGPFHLRTLELGAFFGVFHKCRLVAMAGQRLSLPGYVEVSAVCTHPDFRGRGYAPALMSTVMEHIVAHGKTPILHSFSSNAVAIAVYRSLGFTFRRSFHLAVLRNDL